MSDLLPELTQELIDAGWTVEHAQTDSDEWHAVCPPPCISAPEPDASIHEMED